MAVPRIDLNADVGEYVPPQPDDSLLLPALTSVSIACGFHAGSPDVMRHTVRLAKTHGVAIGAHPSFPDREHFGRREMRLTPAEVESLVAYQVGALAALASLEGVALQHVKPHGALFNMASRDADLADAVAAATAVVDRSLILFGLPNSQLIAAGHRAGLRTASEGFADRAYRRDGSLVPRSEPSAVIEDPDTVVARAMEMVFSRSVTAIDGAVIPLPVDTICVHGDTPGAALLARRIRAELVAAGVGVKAVGA
jgi:UPF0271 protein